jgi:hypothetical protein
MMKTALLGIATATMAFAAAPAAADPWKDESGHGRYERGYDRDGRYYEPRRVSRRDTWRGRDGRQYCRRSNGTTGLVIGAAGGALAGRAIDSRGERTTGTILGAAAGALLGREVEKELKCK